MKRIGMLAALLIVAATACGTAAVDESAGGAADGIGVRGDWTISVYDADGTFDRELEIHNEFIGAAALADLTTGLGVANGWRVVASTTNDLCDQAAAGLDPGGGRCVFGDGAGPAYHGPIDVSIDGATDEVVLAIEFSAETAGSIDSLESSLVVCPIATPSCSFLGNDVGFSQRTLTSPVEERSVEAGQTVQIEVRYSFSSI